MGFEDLSRISGKEMDIGRFANEFSGILNLPGRLGLTVEVDVQLLELSLGARFARNPKSARERLLERPELDYLRLFPLMRKMIQSLEDNERLRREAREEFVSEVQQFIEQKYPSPEGRQHARMIDMAINDLVAKGLHRGEEHAQTTGRPAFCVDEIQVDQWTEYWRPRIAGLE